MNKTADSYPLVAEDASQVAQLGVDQHRPVVVRPLVDELERRARYVETLRHALSTFEVLAQEQRGRRRLILKPSTQMSFRSFTYASISSWLSPRVTSSALVLRSNSDRGTKTQ